MKKASSSEFFDLIQRRRSIRSYEQTSIEEVALKKIIEAGRMAPSGGNNQTAHLIVITNPKLLDELKRYVTEEFQKKEIEENMYKSFKNAITAAKKGNYDFMYSAPVLIVVANQASYGNAIADSACVLENMMLAATALNIGSCWINQLRWLDDNQVIREFLEKYGLENNEMICGALSLGYASKWPEGSLPRTGNRVTYVD